jgi:DNA repair protein RecO
MKIKLKTHCFLLKKQPYSESSFLLQVFAENHGLISILAKGMRKNKERQDILLNTLNEFEVIISEPATPGLYTLNELCLVNEYPADLPLETWICAQAGAELLTKLLIPQDEIPPFYLALRQYLTYQKAVTANPIAIFWRFTLHIIKLLGVPVVLNQCADCHCLTGSRSLYGDTVIEGKSICAYRADTGQLICNDCQLNYGTVHRLTPECISILELIPVIGNYLNDLSISAECLNQLNHFFLHYLSCQFHQPIHLKSLDYYTL